MFFLTDRNKKDTGIDRKDVKADPIGSVAVIGAGIMGQGIAAATLKRQLPVMLADAQIAALSKGIAQVLEEVSFDKTKKGPDAKKAVKFAGLLNAATVDAELAPADLVIEAIVENPEVKKAVLCPHRAVAQRERHPGVEPPRRFRLRKLADGLKHPERFCGIHFFNPVRKMPLVEVIRGEKTSDETVATAVAYAKNIGKSPIVVNDGPGFLVNRLLLPYMNEALELISDGAEVKAIEKAAKEFGMPMGPITLYDVVGLDTAYYAGRVMYEAFPGSDRGLADSGRDGQGWPAGDKSRAAGSLPTKTRAAGELPIRKQNGSSSNTSARSRSLPASRLRIACSCRWCWRPRGFWEAKVVRNVRDVDLGLIFGVGFPPFKGGLLFWADTLGAAKIVELLKPLESLGSRAQPTPLLLEMAASGKKFYDM